MPHRPSLAGHGAGTPHSRRAESTKYIRSDCADGSRRSPPDGPAGISRARHHGVPHICAQRVCREIPLLSAVGFDSLSIPLAPSAASPHGVSVPLVPPSSAASVPLAPPAGIAAPAHPTVPSSASAAFSPPSEGNRGAPPPHRFHIGRPPCGKERMVGEVKKGGGYSQSAGSTSAGLRSAGRSPPHSVVHPPGRQGISRDTCGSRPRIGSCMRRSTARTRHPPCALRGTDKLNRGRTEFSEAPLGAQSRTYLRLLHALGLGVWG